MRKWYSCSFINSAWTAGINYVGGWVWTSDTSPAVSKRTENPVSNIKDNRSLSWFSYPDSFNTRYSLTYLLTYVLTYLLTHSRSWAFLEHPPIVQPLKNFPACYGTRRFNTVFTRALHWSLSWAISIQSTQSHPISLRSILILSTYLRLGLPSGLFPSDSPINILYAFLFSPFVLHAPPISSFLTWSF
jgi:hypothetical protein